MSEQDKPGYIPLFRKFFDHYLWEEDREYSKAEAWIDCIQMARYKKTGKKKLVSGNLISWGYGQFPASVRFLKKRWGWGSNTKVENFLNMLESDKMIEVNKGQGQNIITLCNYSIYDIKNNSEKTSKGQGKDERRTNEGQNSKKGKKGNKGNTIVSPSRNDRPISDLSKRDFDFSDGADEDELIDRLTFRVYKMIAHNIPETHKHMRDATISKWRDPIRLMKTSDGLSLHEIFELCQFATEDDFWSTTVSSTSGIRKNLAEIQKAILKQQKLNNEDLTWEEMLDEVSLYSNRKVSDYKIVDVNGKKRYRYEQ